MVTLPLTSPTTTSPTPPSTMPRTKPTNGTERPPCHSGYTANVQDKAEYETLKLPAWHNKVGHNAGYTYTASLHEAAAYRRENAAVDYHHYPTPTTDTSLVRYSAWHNKVSDDAGYTYTTSIHEAAADRRENSALDYHHYPTTNTNTSLVRY